MSTNVLTAFLSLSVAASHRGWNKGKTHAPSGMEVWVYRPKCCAAARSGGGSNDDGGGDGGSAAGSTALEPPLVLIPGAGKGILSFLPLVAFFQASQAHAPTHTGHLNQVV